MKCSTIYHPILSSIILLNSDIFTFNLYLMNNKVLTAVGILVAVVLAGVFSTTPSAFAYHTETNTEQSVNQENVGSDTSSTSPVEETILTSLLPAER
jgi:hypothetical protein